jgi:hypothetical protein
MGRPDKGGADQLDDHQEPDQPEDKEDLKAQVPGKDHEKEHKKKPDHQDSDRHTLLLLGHGTGRALELFADKHSEIEDSWEG